MPRNTHNFFVDKIQTVSEMQFFLAMTATLFTTVALLSSCIDIISTSDWLDYTRWKADLSSYSDIDEGIASLEFMPDFLCYTCGYTCDGRVQMSMSKRSKAESLLFYDFPSIKLSIGFRDDEDEIVLEGIFSADHKKLVVKELYPLGIEGVVFRRLNFWE